MRTDLFCFKNYATLINQSVHLFRCLCQEIESFNVFIRIYRAKNTMFGNSEKVA